MFSTFHSSSSLCLLFCGPFCRAKALGLPILRFVGLTLRASRHRAIPIHRLDLRGVALVHEFPLQLHGRRQLLVLRGELALDQMESLMVSTRAKFAFTLSISRQIRSWISGARQRLA